MPQCPTECGSYALMTDEPFTCVNTTTNQFFYCTPGVDWTCERQSRDVPLSTNIYSFSQQQDYCAIPVYDPDLDPDVDDGGHTQTINCAWNSLCAMFQ